LSDPGLLMVLTGPSGAGKTTLVRQVQQWLPELMFSVSFTTRPPRAGEVDGVDYRFVDHADFEARLGNGEFLEHARVHGNLYGTHRPSVEQAVADGGLVLLDIDVQGAVQVKASDADAVYLFVLPPSLEELEARLRGRATDPEDVIARRLVTARGELAQAPWFEYLLVNDEVDPAARALEAVLRAERLRRARPHLAARLDLAGLSQARG